MNTKPPPSATPLAPHWVLLLMAFSCGTIVANLYYAQPLIGLIAKDTGLDIGAAGFLVTLTQIGYGLGLLFLVPLGDLLEPRKLVVSLMVLIVLALVSAAMSGSAQQFLISSLVIGISSAAAQVLVPFGSELVAPKDRGKAVGSIMSGLLFGILLSRPLASMLASWWGWHAVFWLSAGLNTVLALALLLLLPNSPLRAARRKSSQAQASEKPNSRKPSTWRSYRDLLHSLWPLLRDTPLLQRRAAYQAGMFGAFSLFWTSAPLLLMSPAYGYGQRGVALFAVVGAGGALVSPWVGRLADRGWTYRLSGYALAAAALSLLLSLRAGSGGGLGLTSLVLAALVLDMAVAATLITGQRSIYALDDATRSRLNALYMALFFSGGAIGSALGAWVWVHGGWLWVALVGLAFPCAALAVYFVADGPHKEGQAKAAAAAKS